MIYNIHQTYYELIICMLLNLTNHNDHQIEDFMNLHMFYSISKLKKSGLLLFCFRPSSDEFFVRATVDIESEGRESKETLENQLRYFISNSRDFNPSSPLTVIDKGFDIIQGK